MSLCAEKSFSFSVALHELKKLFFSANHKPFFRTSLSLLLSKAILFHPPLPISTPLNLLFAKNAAVLLLFALILCCKAGASHRFKSLPAIPGEVAAFRKTGYLMNAGNFRKNHVSTGDLNRPRSPEVRKPLVCFLVLFAQRKKHEKRSFRRKLRGFANLEAAHTNNKLGNVKICAVEKSPKSEIYAISNLFF